VVVRLDVFTDEFTGPLTFSTVIHSACPDHWSDTLPFHIPRQLQLGCLDQLPRRNCTHKPSIPAPLQLAVMSRYRLSNVFNDQYTYTYTPLPNPDPEAECFICKTPYSPHDPDGCQAIQLNPCGHIIGHSCFTEWINRAPQSCPYWSHHHPPTLKPSVGDESLEVKFLRWLVHTKWITQIDDRYGYRLERIKDPRRRREAGYAVEALAEGALTDRHVHVLTHWIDLMIFVVSVKRPALHVLVVLFLVGHMTGLCLSDWYGWVCSGALYAGMQRAFFVGLFLFLAHAYAYCAITRWVLKLGLRRSSASKRRVVVVGMAELFWSGFRLGKKSK